MEVKTIISTDYNELEQMFKDIYGREYEIMPCEEVGSSQYAATYTQHIDGKPLADYEQEDFNGWLNGEDKMYILSSIMNDLCAKGCLAKGEYIIDVNW